MCEGWDIRNTPPTYATETGISANTGLICRLNVHFGVAFCLCLSLEGMLVRNISHENDLILRE